MPPRWVLNRLYPIADAQLGYFTSAQAGAVGVDRRYLAHHVGTGNVEHVERGVYRLRHYPHQRFEDVMVAILWAGEGAVASHDTALAVYGLADAMPPVIHLTVDRRFRGRRDGVIIHRACLDNDAVTLREGIPITTPLRTIIDVTADPSVAIAAATEAVERGLVRAGHLRAAATTVPQLRPILERMPSA